MVGKIKYDMIKICHITTVHPRYDVRIFYKECKSLQKNGFNVNLIVADDKGDEIKDNIKIFDVGKETSRLKRMMKSPSKIYAKALELDADIYHFHDPELIFIGKKLINKNKRVIYDVHEDVPLQILSKPYLNLFLRKIVSKIFEYHENKNVKKFSHIITATDFIKERFLKINNNTGSIKNYPIVDELKINVNRNNKKNSVCYVGAVAKIRGISEIVKAMEFTDCKLNLAGKFDDKKLRDEIIKYKSWNKVTEYGFADRETVKQIYEESKAGLVTLHPTVNYKDALPVKLFEYMLAGIPVISSNIPLWQKIVEENNCGLCVNPYNPKEIAGAINIILNDDILAEKMGLNGQKAVIDKYNWAIEEKKLINIYKKVNAS